MKKWNKLPKSMQNAEVKKYYNILQRKKLSLFIKRLFDILFSIIGLALLSPLFLLLSIAIKIDSKGPVFYRQERITTYGRTFRIFKFRTMVYNADKIGALVTTKGDNRITRMGALIRKCRLDEIPQLINILVGDMSFVGTRPEVKKYVNRYTDEMKATLLMRAGVTSYASIYYKDEDEILTKYAKTNTDIDEVYVSKILPQKMKHNLGYIKSFSPIEDIKIIFKTAFAVLKKDKGAI